MNSRQLNKNCAKEIIRTSKPSPIAVGLVFILITTVISVLISRLTLTLSEADLRRFMEYYYSGNYEYALRLLESYHVNPAYQVLALLLQILSTLIGMGYTIFIINTVRKNGACVGNLLDGFPLVLHVILLEILEVLFIFLWSLLLIIPGLIAAYKYRMARYLLIDRPELGVMQCLKESKRMMKGHKWELFVYDLSFLGWTILCAFPGIGTIASIWATPYMHTTYVLFYEGLRGAAYETAAPFTGADYTNNPPWEG